MIDFEHFIVTRFNLPGRWSFDKNKNSVRDNSWLEHRFKIFQKYCLFSIKKQTIQNFSWLVYFDVATPNKFKLIINEISSTVENFLPIFVESYDEFERHLGTFINEKHTKTKIITTRLDNDDMLASNSVELIQYSGHLMGNGIIEFPLGYLFDLRTSRLFEKWINLNPFISLVETKSKLKNQFIGVYAKEHNKWKNQEHLIASEKPQWVQIIHERNKLNEIEGLEIDPRKITSYFSLELDHNYIRPKIFFLKRSINDYMKKNKLSRIIRANYFYKNLLKFKRKWYRIENKIDHNSLKLGGNKNHSENALALSYILSQFPAKYYSPLTSWSLEPIAIMHVLNHIILHDKKQIIEFGSGFSTVCIAQIIRNNSLRTKFAVIENDPISLDRLKRELEFRGLIDFVTLILAPVVTVESELAFKNQELWYDQNSIGNNLYEFDSIDTIVVDGPVGASTPCARYSALPFLLERLSEDCFILLDDTDREDELEIIHAWHKTIGGELKMFNNYSTISKEKYTSLPFVGR